MDTNILIILVLSIVSLFLSLSIINNDRDKSNESNDRDKKEILQSLISSSDCDSGCIANTLLNPLILSLIPNPITIGDIANISWSNANTYVYTKKGCQVQPITLVLTTYASLNINNASLINNLFPFSTGLTQLSIDNVFLSIEIFIDCNTLKLSVKDMFIDISNENPKTQVNTGTLYDTLINGIISNNSHSINFQQPSCSFYLTTCNLSSDCNSQTDPSCCRSLVKQINLLIQQNLSLIPSVDVSSSSGTLSLICGN